MRSISRAAVGAHLEEALRYTEPIGHRFSDPADLVPGLGADPHRGNRTYTLAAAAGAGTGVTSAAVRYRFNSGIRPSLMGYRPFLLENTLNMINETSRQPFGYGRWQLFKT
jgi:hypothetical protein